MVKRPTAPRRPTAGAATRTRTGHTGTTTKKVSGGSTAAPTPLAERPAAPEPDRRGDGIVVQASDRFRDLVRLRPWHRRRRRIIGGILGGIALLAAALAALLFLPTFQIQQTEVTGTDYVETAEVDQVLSTAHGSSVLLAPTGDLETSLRSIPGVQDAEVQRDWPDGLRATITERTPVAEVSASSGVRIVDAEGTDLPAEAAEGRDLADLVVADGAEDPAAVTDAMLGVLGEMPESLRDRVTRIQASTPSDVSLVVTTEEQGTKTVVWGDTRDGELKAEVVAALLDAPGEVIDVSSPVAPVTR